MKIHTVFPESDRSEGSEVGLVRTVWVASSSAWIVVDPDSLIAYSLVKERRPAAQPTSSSYSSAALASSKSSLYSGYGATVMEGVASPSLRGRRCQSSSYVGLAEVTRHAVVNVQSRTA
jgi:hypothetical protein